MKTSDYIPDRIKRTSRTVGFALWLGGADDFLGLVPIFKVRLSEDERAGLAYAALRSLNHEHACWIADAAIEAMEASA